MSAEKFLSRKAMKNQENCRRIRNGIFPLKDNVLNWIASDRFQIPDPRFSGSMAEWSPLVWRSFARYWKVKFGNKKEIIASQAEEYFFHKSRFSVLKSNMNNLNYPKYASNLFFICLSGWNRRPSILDYLFMCLLWLKNTSVKKPKKPNQHRWALDTL